MRKLGLLACTLILTGCVGGSKNVAPIEDRSRPVVQRAQVPQTPPPSGTIIEAPVASGVTVNTIDHQPVQQVTQQAKSRTEPSSGSWVTARAAEREHRVNPAVVALLDSARTQARSGSYNAAASTLERAQRIAPREPEVYYEMSRVRMKAGDWQQAEQLALKGVQLSGGSAPMMKKLWNLIADIRDDAGDRTGAQRARIKARRY